MNVLINNVYTAFEEYLEEYNRQRSEKIELAYVGECQGFYVFSGDWQNIFLINNEGGFEIYFKTNEPKTVMDLEACQNYYWNTRAERDFNYKTFIKWLYKRNTLVKDVNWTNLQVINYIKKCTTKIQPFEGDILISEKTGKHCGTCIGGSILGGKYFVETYDYEDRPHCIIKEEDEVYRFYLPDKIPKTQKELEIVPDFPFKKELYAQKVKDLKQYAIEFISKRNDDNKHKNYYELLLLYRAFNPNVKVEPIKNNNKFSFKNKVLNPRIISFCKTVVIEYAKRQNVNPFTILADMFDKGYIDAETRININTKEDFIKEYSYLFEEKQKEI